MAKDDYDARFTAHELAEVLGLSVPAVVELIDAGRLPAQRRGDGWLAVRIADVRALRDELDRERAQAGATER